MSEDQRQPAPAPVPVPGIITALAILLYVGAATLGLSAFRFDRQDLGGILRALEYALFSVLYVVLGLKVRQRRRWARLVLLLLCGWSGLLAVAALIAGSPYTAVTRLIWPVTYLVLLGTRVARQWFRSATRLT